MVYLVGTGANPSGTLYFPKLAANNGFHVVSLKYPNSLSAQVPCRTCPDEDCYEDFRKEILEGIDYSSACKCRCHQLRLQQVAEINDLSQ
jgi:hypothetical protein